MKIEKRVNEKINYKLRYVDMFEDGIHTIEVDIEDNINFKTYEFSFDYHIGNKQIVQTCCMNQKILSEDDLIIANTMFDLLNEEIKKVSEFVISMF